MSKASQSSLAPSGPPATVDPVEVGIDPARLQICLDRVRVEVESGRLPSAQLAVARHGQLAYAGSFGDAGSRYLMQSAGRAHRRQRPLEADRRGPGRCRGDGGLGDP